MNQMTDNETSNNPTKPTLVIGLIISIVVCFTAAAIGGFATAGSVDSWLAGLNKPSWNPPNWIFGPVWSALYLMMAISAWLVWQQSGLKKATFPLSWFVFHLMLNVSWSIIFFGLHQPGWAAVEIVVLWASIAFTIVLFYQHSRLAAALLIPYLAWVTFATFLNFSIWMLNRGT